MNVEVTTLDLSSRRRSIIGYSAGMALYVFAVVALYPSFKDSAELDTFTQSSPGVAALFGISGSLTSPVGWLNANIYGNFFPLVILLLTIGYGAYCLAGQEQDGHLELVLSVPFSRGKVVLEKIGALVVQALVFSLVVFGAVLIGRAFELTIDVTHLATTTLAVALLGIDFGLVALLTGGASGNRGHALALASTIAAVSYLISSMAPLVDWLKPLRYLSLFYWSVGNDQLDKGASIGGIAVLVGVGVALAIASLITFDRHDLG